MAFWLSILTALNSLLEGICAQFCHPIPFFFQCQGIFITISLSAGWVYAAQSRLRALRALQDKEDGDLAANGGSLRSGPRKAFRADLPKVSVVLPVKGVSQHSRDNWRAQLGSGYEGPLEFLFVMEADDDPARAVLLELQEEHKDMPCVRLLVAGESTQCSQKIHNQLVGVAAIDGDSRYVLFLDDDIRLHPGTIGDLVEAMEDNPKTFLVTGYPFDVPAGQLAGYCVLGFHLPLFIGFSTGGTTTFVWGGCMLMHSADLREDRYGVVSALREGGYSDDMTLAAISRQHGTRICVTDTAVFLHAVAPSFSMARFWNYLRRQIFVLETYSCMYNRCLNRLLLLVHCWLSWSLVLPLLPAALHLAHAATRRHLEGASPHSCPAGLSLAWGLLLALVLAAGALQRLIGAVLDLCNGLSPRSPPVPLRLFQLHKVFLGLAVINFLYPLCALYTVWKADVEWSGVRYFQRNGKIERIERPPKAQPHWENKSSYQKSSSFHSLRRLLHPCFRSLTKSKVDP